MLQPNGLLMFLAGDRGPNLFYTFFSGKTSLRVLPVFIFAAPHQSDGVHSELQSQGVTFIPKMRHDPEQLRDSLGVGIRAGVSYFSARKNP